MNWKAHCYRVGGFLDERDKLPAEEDARDAFVASARKRIEPWLSAVFQAEHLNLLVGSGFTSAVGHLAGASATGMSKVRFGTAYDAAIDTHAEAGAKLMNRGTANVEDQFRSALAVLNGLEILNSESAKTLKTAVDGQMSVFLSSLLASERGIAVGADKSSRQKAQSAAQSFLLSFASRAASRERLHVFTTNYDRLIEHGCDMAGLRINR